ncbi:uncharacterized protein LOC129587312 [Paramacrobiotus metropolitanus]|uniref:uncharacterized protein LOC129587312 n=1 Tax=Paramacrobiotus metropolitanus TaxID=2943436 RepID=UPI0024461FE6|nr:uncharacterized protein LOC129587312 [Paramacrobiotus metropolitanus]
MLTRARLRRVCSAWNALLTTRPALRQHVTFDFRLRPTSANLSDDMFLLGRALFRCLTGDVQTLTLRHWTPGLAQIYNGNADLVVLAYILPLVVSGPVPRLVLQHCIVQEEISLNWRDRRAMYPRRTSADNPVGVALRSPLHWVSPMVLMCRRLIVRDYVMQDVFRRFKGFSLFDPPFQHTYTWLKGARAVDIRVADARLDATSDTDTILSVVIQAMETAVAPTVSAAMDSAVKVMLEYWRSLPAEEAHRYWAVVKAVLALTDPRNPAWHLPPELDGAELDPVVELAVPAAAMRLSPLTILAIHSICGPASVRADAAPGP